MDREAPASQAGAGSITRERLVRLIQRGDILGRCVAGRWLVDTEDLKRWKAEQQTAGSRFPIPAERRTLAETVGQFHMVGVRRQQLLEQLGADLLEASAAGDANLEAEIGEALKVLPLASYRRTETGQWEVTLPGVGSCLSALPVPA
jgi:hypothetical protein